jgi:putative DNA primase/helicase
MTVSDEERADRYLRRNPDASVAELAGALGIAPDKARGFLEGEPTDGAEQETELVNMSNHGRGGVRPIDRSSQFGNPFKLEKDGGEYETREESIQKYREWFADKIRNDPDFRQAVDDLRGDTLGCWCKPEACHGDVILEYLNGGFAPLEDSPAEGPDEAPEPRGKTAEEPDEAPEPRGKTAEEPDEAPDETPEPPNEANEEPPTPSEHYDRLGELYATLGEIDGWHCPGNRDFYGWYRTRQGPGAWDGEGRAWALGKEFAGIRQELERVAYATVNYAPAKWFMDSWQPFNYEENGKEWQDDEKPTPGYGDLRAYAPFADIDLTDDVKRKRPEGDAPQETIERALSLYLEAFGELAGSMEHVYALDSVGGAYAFVAPTATAPIAEAFDRRDRAIIFEDMTDRLNEWLEGVKDDVNAAVPDAAGTFEPDLLNNKNRLYKAPMSIHSSLDGVVTPVDPENPSYDYTPIEAVDDDAIADAEAWADGFTSDHTDAVSAVVANLWPDYYADADGWRDAVSARIDDLTEEREANRERNRQTLSVDDLPDDIEETGDIEVVNATIETIDCRDVARDVADEWDTAPGRDPPRFDPPWRSSDSGTSCYADAEKYVDLKEGKKGGGPLTLVARASGILTSSRDRLRGNDYWKAVNELRKLGYEIPYFTGSSGTHPDALQLFDEAEDTDDQRRKAVRALRASKRQ